MAAFTFLNHSSGSIFLAEIQWRILADLTYQKTCMTGSRRPIFRLEMHAQNQGRSCRVPDFAL